MPIVIDNPSTFFFDLLQQSSRTHKISLPQEVEVYLLHTLVQSLTTINSIDFENPLSLKYLEATAAGNKTILKQVGDSCLIILGLFPMYRVEHRTLYRELGPTCYAELDKNIYYQLSSHFASAVDLLLGASLLLNNTNALTLWHLTYSHVARRTLREFNVIPLRGGYQ